VQITVLRLVFRLLLVRLFRLWHWLDRWWWTCGCWRSEGFTLPNVTNNVVFNVDLTFGHVTWHLAVRTGEDFTSWSKKAGFMTSFVGAQNLTHHVLELSAVSQRLTLKYQIILTTKL